MKDNYDSEIEKEIMELLKDGKSAADAFRTLRNEGKNVSRAQVERTRRNFVTSGGIVGESKKRKPTSEQSKTSRPEVPRYDERPLRERLSFSPKKVISEPKKEMEYILLINGIMAGKSFTEICEENKEYSVESIDALLKKFEEGASKRRQLSDGSWEKDEKMIALLRSVRQTKMDTTINKVKRETNIFGECKYGKIDNMIINVFENSQYKAYYVFTRMKSKISFDEKYDKGVYERIKRETRERLVETIKNYENLKKAANRNDEILEI